MTNNEQARRAVSAAVVSARIEGYNVIDSESETLCMELAEGSITQSEYIQQILEMSTAVFS